MAQQNYTIGNLKDNTEKICNVVKHYAANNDLIIFPELSICGYPPLDLVHRPGFIEKQLECLEKIRVVLQEVVKESESNCKLALGVVSIAKNGKKLHNSICLLDKDKNEDNWYNKQLLPTYNIFDEMRYFEPGNDDGVFEIAGRKYAFLICEDLWNESKEALYGTNSPVWKAFKMNSEIEGIISINASPSNINKLKEREVLAKTICKEYRTQLFYVNQIGAQDDLVFDGNSFAMDKNGELLCCGKGFEEDVILVDTENATEKKSMALPEYSNEELMYNHLVLGIKDYVEKCNAPGALISSSGGIDSAVVMALAVDALGPDRVEAVTMPSKYSSKGSVDDSDDLCKNIGIKLYNMDIIDDLEVKKSKYEKTFGRQVKGLTEENLQARLRGVNIMARSNDTGYLVLATGNKSEMSVGYFTIYGDSCGALAPLGDLFKMEVYALARYINEKHGVEKIPMAIIDKAPSAELSEEQLDTDSLPPYPVLDAILRLYIEGDLLPEENAKECLEIIEESDISKDEVKRIVNMVDRSEFKRRQCPVIIRCNRRAFGPGRRLPVAQRTEFVSGFFEKLWHCEPDTVEFYK